MFLVFLPVATLMLDLSAFFFFLFKRNTKPRVTGVNPKTQIGMYLLLVGACSWVNYKLSAA